MATKKTMLLQASLVVLAAVGIKGHGYMAEPCQRSSLWRLGYPTPVNHAEDGLNCGGFETQWATNQGRCGECGDSWAEQSPRENENGGKYGMGFIAHSYKQGQLINVKINITQNHMGYFEYRLCPMDGVDGLPEKPAPQECLDKYLLKLEDGNTKWMLPSNASQVFEMKVQLPPTLKCKSCVMQWTWITEQLDVLRRLAKTSILCPCQMSKLAT
ncbi:uncharacterized protein [Hetaerina americana]|uniref:uncharacterized protein n=1 Tax=Hetaerina americana TaxID=62018 RepID=UPI003A7F1F21